MLSPIHVISNLMNSLLNINHSNVCYMLSLEEPLKERNVYKSSLCDPFQKVVFLHFGRQPYYQIYST